MSIRIWLATASSVVTAMLLALVIGGPSPLNAAIADITDPYGSDCKVAPHFFDEGKEVNGAFGAPITSDPSDEDGIRAELRERRSCGEDNQFDPGLLASHYVATANATLPSGEPANLTSIKVGWNDVNSFSEQLASNRDLYKQVSEELNTLEDEAAFSVETVQRGTPSLFMVANEQSATGVTIKQGIVSNDGHNAVFTYANGAVVKYRIECGAQPTFASPPPGVPECVGEECAPPPACPEGTQGTWPDCNELKWQQPSPTEPGWTPRGTDNGLTDGRESARQIESGETRGNAVNDQVPSNTGNGTVTPDTVHSNEGGPVADGATSGGDDQSQGAVDEDNTNQDDSGTNGDTCVPDGVVVLTCP